jgi:HAD superfamily hydrolase (TIGR01509 family)
MSIQGLIFDCDGVLADTELHGHLVAFNRMWQDLGIPWQWTAEQYAEKLKIGGGKERMAALLNESVFRNIFRVPDASEERKALIAQWHAKKTAIYQDIISSGAIPARSGIARIANAALDSGWKLAVASTSAKPSVDAVLKRVVGESTAKRFTAVLAGDIVASKKPATDIYRLALEKLGLAPEDCVAIEDSRNGLLSANGAGIPVLITISSFTTHENFSEAPLVVSSLGDPGAEQSRVLQNAIGRAIGNYVKLEDVAAMGRIAL